MLVAGCKDEEIKLTLKTAFLLWWL